MIAENNSIDSKVLNHIKNFENEFKQVVISKEGESFNYSEISRHASGNTYNYYNNGWYWPTVNSATYVNKNKDEEEKEKKDDTGNHPIIFLVSASVLAFSATYAIATDGYLQVSKKFKKMDEIIELMDDDYRGTKYDQSYIKLKKNYALLKDKIIQYYKPAYHSKLGLFGSGLLGITYFWPFGYFALAGSIVGLTGFGCYWLWHKLTDGDEKCSIIENIKNINNYIDEIKNDNIKDIKEAQAIEFNIWPQQNIYPSIEQRYNPPTAPSFDLTREKEEVR